MDGDKSFLQAAMSCTPCLDRRRDAKTLATGRHMWLGDIIIPSSPDSSGSSPSPGCHLQSRDMEYESTTSTPSSYPHYQLIPPDWRALYRTVAYYGLLLAHCFGDITQLLAAIRL